MIMIRAIVRPEKNAEVMKSLLDAGFPGVTKIDVAGRGKQLGIRLDDVVYDELPKVMLVSVVPDDSKDFAIRAIMDSARTDEKGAPGDGKIFVSGLDEVYTISSGTKES